VQEKSRTRLWNGSGKKSSNKFRNVCANRSRKKFSDVSRNRTISKFREGCRNRSRNGGRILYIEETEEPQKQEQRSANACTYILIEAVGDME